MSQLQVDAGFSVIESSVALMTCGLDAPDLMHSREYSDCQGYCSHTKAHSTPSGCHFDSSLPFFTFIERERARKNVCNAVGYFRGG